MKEIQLVVKAYANIALVKYWGKQAVEGNIPAVGSLSIGLDALCSETRIKVNNSGQHRLTLDGMQEGKAVERAKKFIELICSKYGKSMHFDVDSSNNFPTGAGLASSASGFAALTLAVTRVLGLEEEPGELSRLARQGSGSAARSLFGGFVEMSAGADASASPLLAAKEWPLEVIIAITSTAQKKIGSTEGMLHTASTSPYYSSWVNSHEVDMKLAREAISKRSFADLAKVSEHSCMKMHSLMMSANPALIYWNSVTLDLIHRVRELQADGLALFFTIDAGPQLKIVCQPGEGQKIFEKIKNVPGVLDVILTRVGGEPEVSGGKSLG